MIKVSKYDVKIAGTRILKSLDFCIEGNQIVGLLGPNGAGKSTLIKSLCSLPGLEVTGQVELLGRKREDWKGEEIARFRSYLSQSTNMPFPFSVEDVVMMGSFPHNKGIYAGKDFELLDEILKKLDLSGFRKRPFPALSGGQQQRVLFARLLLQVTHPDVVELPKLVFLDEPTANLDWQYQLQLLQMAKELKELNCLVVVAIHDVNQAIEYCDALLLLKEGELMHAIDDLGEAPIEALESLYEVNLRACELPEGGYQLLARL